ncbi:hypothetical protein [Bartonella sp. AP4SXKL]
MAVCRGSGVWLFVGGKRYGCCRGSGMAVLGGSGMAVCRGRAVWLL